MAHAFAKEFKTEAPWYGAWNIIPILKFSFNTFFTLPTSMSVVIFPQLALDISVTDIDHEVIDKEDIKELHDNIMRDISPSTPEFNKDVAKWQDSPWKHIFGESPLSPLPSTVTSPQFPPEGSALSAATEVRTLTDRLAAMKSPQQDAILGVGNQAEHQSPLGPLLLSPILLQTSFPPPPPGNQSPSMSPVMLANETMTPESQIPDPADRPDLTPDRVSLLESIVEQRIAVEAEQKSTRIPDFVLKLIEAATQKDGKSIEPIEIKCHRTLLIIEVKPEKPLKKARQALKRLWPRQVTEQAIYTLKKCPALARVGAIVAYGPLWFYDEIDRHGVFTNPPRPSGDNAPYQPSESGSDFDNDNDDDDDDNDNATDLGQTFKGKFRPQAKMKGVAEPISDIAMGASEPDVHLPDSTHYKSLHKTFHMGPEAKLTLLPIFSPQGMAALQLVGARLMELAVESWPELGEVDEE